jgi:predicted CxxxxCH...CXXCH cytochrome family protein
MRKMPWSSGIYGTLTGTGNVSNDPKVGAHDSHLSARYGLTGPVQCTDCHPARTTPTDANHMTGTTAFLWSSLTTSSGSLPTGYTAATGQCSAVYCHGDGFGAGVKGNATQPAWTNSAYLTGNRASGLNREVRPYGVHGKHRLLRLPRP